jgi:hypothetical protein
MRPAGVVGSVSRSLFSVSSNAEAAAPLASFPRLKPLSSRQIRAFLSIEGHPLSARNRFARIHQSRWLLALL